MFDDFEYFDEYLHLIATMLHSLKMDRRVQEQLWASSQCSSMPDVQNVEVVRVVD